MGSDYGLSTEHLRAAERIIQDGRRRFEGLARRLEADVQSQIGEGWQGRGAHGFGALHAHWQEENHAVLAILDSLVEGLRGTTNQAMSAEAEALDRIRTAERVLADNPRFGRLG